MKTRTTICGLFAMLARPILDAIADERCVWVKRRAVAPCPALVVEPIAAVATPEPAPVVAPAPIELAVVPPAPVETATVISPAPTPAMVTTTATKKVRTRKPALVMAGAARTTVKRSRKNLEVEAVEPAQEMATPEPVSPPFRVQMSETKTDRDWSIAFTPITGPGPTAGVLEITSKRSHAKYAVMEFPTGWEGRGFTLAKLEGGTDRDNSNYSVFCSQGGPEADSCDCKGSSRFDHCKHRNAIRALILNKKL